MGTSRAANARLASSATFVPFPKLSLADTAESVPDAAASRVACGCLFGPGLPDSNRIRGAGGAELSRGALFASRAGWPDRNGAGANWIITPAVLTGAVVAGST